MSTLTPNPDSPLASPTGYETAGGGNSTLLGSPTFGGGGAAGASTGTTPLPPPTPPPQPAALSWGHATEDDSVEALASPSGGQRSTNNGAPFPNNGAGPSGTGSGSGKVHRAADAAVASQSAAAVRSGRAGPAASLSSHRQAASAGNRRSIIASSAASPRPNTGRSDRSGGGLASRPAAEPVLSPLEKLPALPPPLRIAVVGAAKTGKTQIINRYLAGCYSRAYAPTPKIQLGLKALHTANLGHGYALEIWDVPASAAIEESFVESGLLEQMDGAIIVSDAGDLRSFQAVRKWADVFTEHALLRLADNLAALGLDENGGSDDSATTPALAAHSLRTGPDGKLALVSAFPCILFANKADGGTSAAVGGTQLSAQDIFDSAKHFKLAAGFLGSALTNRSVLPQGTQPPAHFLPRSYGAASGSAAAAAAASASPAAAAGSAAAALQALNLHPSDGGIEQSFAFLAAEMLKYQHLLSITPALQAANALSARGGSGGGGGGGGAEPPSSRGAHSSANGLDGLGMSTQRAQVGSAMTHRGSLIAGDLTSRRLMHSATGPAVPLPASLASLRQRSALGGTRSPGAAAGSSAFSFNRAGNAATAQQPKSNQLAAAAAAQAADDAAARAHALQQAADDDAEDSDESDSDDSSGDSDESEDEDEEAEDGEEGGN